MTDFLSRLVDRALGQGPVLRRRRAGVFEPRTALGARIEAPAALHDGGMGTGAYEPARARSDAAPREATVHSATPAPEDRHSADRGSGPAFLASSHLPQPLSTRLQADASERLGGGEPRGRAEGPGSVATRSIADAMARLFPGGIASGATRGDATDREPGPAASAMGRVLPATAASSMLSSGMPVARHPAASPPFDGAVTDRPWTGRPASSVTPAAVRQGLASSPAVPPAVPVGSAAPPTIHVSIGRIEVRALPPAAARSPRPDPTMPRLGLDDYLRSRAGGGR